MCGIVGYVGNPGSGASAEHGGALDVVMEGLARLEYRGYDSAGVALVTADGVDTRKKAGKLVNLVAELEADPLPESVTGIGHTRWATHGGPTDPNAHPHLGGGGRLALIHNGIIENFASLKAGLLADGVEFASETDTEVVAHLLAGHLRRGRRPHRGDAPGLQPARGRLHAARRARRPARHRRRRPPQLPAGRGHRRGRELPRLRRRGLHLAHPRGARARPGPDRHHHPRRGRGHRLRRQAGAGQGVPRRLGRRRRREGRLPELHGQGDPRPAARGGRHPPRPHRRERPAGARRAPDRRGRPARRRPRGRAGLRHLGVRRATWPSTRSSTGPASRWRSSCRTSSATATRSSTTARWSWRSRSPARRWTP